MFMVNCSINLPGILLPRAFAIDWSINVWFASAHVHTRVRMGRVSVDRGDRRSLGFRRMEFEHFYLLYVTSRECRSAKKKLYQHFR